MVSSLSNADAVETKPIRRMTTEKPHAQENGFSLPVFKWGHQRYLRCMKVNPNGRISGDRRSPAPANSSERLRSRPPSLSPLRRAPPPPPPPPPPAAPAESFEEIRAKLLNDLQTVANRMEFKFSSEGREEFDSLRPWNLRSKRAAQKSPEKPPPVDIPARSRVRVPEVIAGERKREKKKFSIPLSREEVEEDFLVMTGSKPHRRPKKRPKIVQRQLDV